MIDIDLSQQLHSLAETMNDGVDIVARHRRISLQSRRRAAVKVGFAGAGVAAVVGGLFVVRDERSGPAGGGLAASSSLAPATTQATTTALPECAVVLAGLQTANSSAAAVVSKRVTTDPSPASDLPDANFKGVVTILTTDGSQITFSSDDPEATPPTSGIATIDAETIWMDGATLLDTAPTIQVGQHVGLATAAEANGVDRVIFVDVGSVSVAPKVADTKPADSTTVDASGAPAKIALPGPSLSAGPTEKSRGTVVGAGATSISVTRRRRHRAGEDHRHRPRQHAVLRRRHAVHAGCAGRRCGAWRRVSLRRCRRRRQRCRDADSLRVISSRGSRRRSVCRRSPRPQYCSLVGVVSAADLRVSDHLLLATR